jgi:hypothetical protein
LHRPLFELLDVEFAGRSVGASYYTPTQDHRDIDVMVLDLSDAWKFCRVFEFQGRFTLFHAHGSRTDAPSGVDPDSTATGFAAGPAVRFYPFDVLGSERVRPYLEGSAQFLFTPDTRDGFPSGGTAVNGFLRAGAGVKFQLGQRSAIEATYDWFSHASNGVGLVPQNPMWNGHGGGIALSRDF